MFKPRISYYTLGVTIAQLVRDRDPNGEVPFVDEFFIDRKIQREKCWDDEDRNSFIESILLGFHQASIVLVDIGRVLGVKGLTPKDKEYFQELVDEYQLQPYSTVDGQNRALDCLLDFLADRYAFTPSEQFGMQHPDIFGATGQNSVTFSQLSHAMQTYIANTEIPVFVYDKISLASYRGLFNAINSGKPPRKAEIRNGYGTDICNNIRTKAWVAADAKINVSSDWYKRHKMHEYFAGYSRLFLSLLVDSALIKTRATNDKMLTPFYKGKKGNDPDYIKKWDDFYDNYFMKLWETHEKDGEYINISNTDIMEMFLTAVSIYKNKLQIKDEDYILRDVFTQMDNRLRTIMMDPKDFEAWAIADRKGDKAKLKTLPVPVETDYKAATDDVWRPNAVKFRWETINTYILEKTKNNPIEWKNDAGEVVVKHKRKQLTHKQQEDLIHLGQLKVDEEVTPVMIKKRETDVDHNYPLSLGGSNEVENLQVLSTETHKPKRTMEPEEFERSREQEQQESLVTEDDRAALPIESCPQQSVLPGFVD